MSGIHRPSLATSPRRELARDVSYWCVFFYGYRRIQRALALGSIATVAVRLAALCASTIEEQRWMALLHCSVFYNVRFDYPDCNLKLCILNIFFSNIYVIRDFFILLGPYSAWFSLLRKKIVTQISGSGKAAVLISKSFWRIHFVL